MRIASTPEPSPKSEDRSGPATAVAVIAVAIVLCFAAVQFKPSPSPDASPESASRTTISEPAQKESEVGSYLRKIGQICTDLHEPTEIFSKNNSRASQDVALLADTQWRIEQAGCITSFKMSAEEIHQMQNVPAQARPLHRILMHMADELGDVRASYIKGVDRMDPRAIQNATDHILSATRYAQASIKPISTLREQYPQ